MCKWPLRVLALGWPALQEPRQLQLADPAWNNPNYHLIIFLCSPRCLEVKHKKFPENPPIKCPYENCVDSKTFGAWVFQYVGCSTALREGTWAFLGTSGALPLRVYPVDVYRPLLLEPILAWNVMVWPHPLS